MFWFPDWVSQWKVTGLDEVKVTTTVTCTNVPKHQNLPLPLDLPFANRLFRQFRLTGRMLNWTMYSTIIQLDTRVVCFLFVSYVFSNKTPSGRLQISVFRAIIGRC